MAGKRVAGPRARAPKVNDDWQVRDALHTLTAADKIRKDARMMAKVRVHAAQQRDALGKIVRAAPVK